MAKPNPFTVKVKAKQATPNPFTAKTKKKKTGWGGKPPISKVTKKPEPPKKMRPPVTNGPSPFTIKAKARIAERYAEQMQQLDKMIESASGKHTMATRKTATKFKKVDKLDLAGKREGDRFDTAKAEWLDAEKKSERTFTLLHNLLQRKRILEDKVKI